MAEGGASIEANDGESSKSTDPAFTVDIKDIATNVKYKLMGLFMEKEGPIKDIFNWKETPDLGDAWFDRKKELRKFAHYGEKRRKVKAPIRDLFKHCFPDLRGSEELKAAEDDIQRTIERHGNRRIEIYNMSAVIAYLSAANGVTVDPYELTFYLNHKKIRSKGKSFSNARKNYNGWIDSRIKDNNGSTATFQKAIRETSAFLDQHSNLTEEPDVMDKQSMHAVNVRRRLFLKAFTKRVRRLKHNGKLYNNFGVTFWDLSNRIEDANTYLFDFLLMYIPNLCKLNPQPKKKPL